MAKYRLANLLAAKSITTAGVEPVDIKIGEKISCLYISLKSTNGDYVPDGHPANSITSIEVVNGSEVLASVDGCGGQALAFYSSKQQPFNTCNFMSGEWSMPVIPIYFGRWLWDPLYNLDPKQFDNLSINITHSYQNGGASLSACTLEVWAQLFDEKEVPTVGFLRTRKIRDAAFAASETKGIAIPTDEDIRMIVLAQNQTTEAPEYNFASFKLTEHGKKNTVVSSDMEPYLRLVNNHWPAWQEKFSGQLLTTSRTFYCTPAFEQTMSLVQTSDSDSTLVLTATGGSVRKMLGEISCMVEGITFGHCPHGSVPFTFGNEDDPDDFWHVDPTDNRELEITTHASHDTSQPTEIYVQSQALY